MSRSSAVVYGVGDGSDEDDVDNDGGGGGDDYNDVDNGGDDDVVDTGGNFSDGNVVDNGGGDSDGFLTALTDEQMCTQSSITGLPNLWTRIILILECFKYDDKNIGIFNCN